MCFAAPDFGVVRRKGSKFALTFCRQSAAFACHELLLVPLRRLGKPQPDRPRIFDGRGAVERVLLRPNPALRSTVCSGLLQSKAVGPQRLGAEKTRALIGAEPTGAGGAGAPIARRLAGSLQAFYRACVNQRQHLLPASPCMNELPSHAPHPIARLLRPDRLYVCPNGAGVQKLY